AGQAYRGDRRAASHWSFSGGSDLDNVVMFVCPSETVAARWRERYDVPAVVVGAPALDRWHAAPPRSRGATITVAVTFHWDCTLIPETRSAWPHFEPAVRRLLEEADRRGWNVVGHEHPKWRG